MNAGALLVLLLCAVVVHGKLVFNKNCEGIPKQGPINVTCDLQCLELIWFENTTFYDWACVPGSVVVDPWLPNALHTQMVLNFNLSLGMAMIPSTHNSLIAHANGYGVEQYAIGKLIDDIPFNKDKESLMSDQQLSLTDQLRMGVRQLEWDTSYAPHTQDFRVCDARVSEVIANIVNKLLPVKSRIEPGCAKHDRPLVDALMEFRAFFDNSTSHDVFVVMLDTPDQDGNSSMLANTIWPILGDIMFTPMDYLAAGFTQLPSMEYLSSINKRLVICSAQFFPPPANQTIFYKYGPYFDGWTEFSPNQFYGGNCTADDNGQVYHTNTGQILRVVDNSIVVGPFYNSVTGSGNVSLPEEHAGALCNFNYMSLDQVNPVFLEQAVWSWNHTQPSVSCRYNSPNDSLCEEPCGAVDLSTGRWQSVACNLELPFTCYDDTTNAWSLSSASGAWSDGAGACQSDGGDFQVPWTGLDNQAMMSAIEAEKGLAYMAIWWDETDLDWRI